MKVEHVPLFEPRFSNLTDIGIILLEPDYEVEVIDDMEIKMIKGQQLKPMRSTPDGLIKREHDTVSGEIPYNQSVS